MLLIIDGYNLIFAGLFYPQSSLKTDKINFKSKDFLLKTRENLISKLKTYMASKKYQIIVVFDGNKSPAPAGQSHQKESPQIEIVFSGRGSTADEVIFQLISARPRESIKVVTSDKSLADTLKKSRPTGIEIISVSKFIRELSIPVRDTKYDEGEPREKFVGLNGNPGAVEKWVSAFGGQENSLR
jgi:predicted RNA-binding protein with PIN domain